MYPHERSLVEKMKDKPFVLIGVNSDSKEHVRAAVEKENITWRSFWDGGSTGGPIARAWGVRGWPTIYIIDQGGVIRHKNVRGEAMDKAVDELVAQAIAAFVDDLQSDDPQVRGLAAFRVGRYQAPDVKSSLSRLLEDSEATVQRRAAVGLALLGEPVAPLVVLLRQAVTDPVAAVRVAGLEQLGKAKDRQSVALALAALEDDTVDVRRVAVAVLGNLKATAALPALAKAVGDPDRETAKAAALALADFGSTESSALLKALAAESQHPARVWIAVAMHRAGEKGTAERFKQLLAEDETTVRRQAVAALGDLTDFDATDLYIQALEDSSAQVRRMASTVLANSQEPRVIEALKKSLLHQIDELVPLLSGRDYRKQREAISQLKDLGPAAAPLLLDQLDQIPERGRFALASTIGQLASPAVIPPILARLQEPELDRSRRYAYEIILRGMRGTAREAVNKLAQHEHPMVRESGVRLLMAYRDAEARKALQLALEDVSSRVRVYAASGLAAGRDPNALSVLKQCVKDGDRTVQNVAVSALAKYDAKIAVPILTELLEDGDRALGSAVAYALGRFKAKEATDAIAGMSAKGALTRHQAIDALQRQDTTDAARALGEFLKDQDSALQQRVRSALQRMRTPAAKKILATPPDSSGPVARDLAKLQGTWTRTYQADDGTAIQVIKQVKGNREKVTRLAEGKVLQVATTDFRLERRQDLRVFTFFNLEILEGPRKGSKSPGERSYIYRLEGNTFTEVWGLLVGDQQPVELFTWERTAESPLAPVGAAGKSLLDRILQGLDSLR